MNMRDEVKTILRSVLYNAEESKDGAPPADAVLVSGVVRDYGFHPQRLAASKPKVKALIDQLDPNFFIGSAGGGGSFLYLPFDKNGEQWGEQIDAEELLALAMGLGMAEYLLPRNFWVVLPGGVPYVCFK